MLDKKERTRCRGLVNRQACLKGQKKDYEITNRNFESDIFVGAADGYEIDWYAIDGGGEVNEESGYTLQGTIGQASR